MNWTELSEDIHQYPIKPTEKPLDEECISKENTAPNSYDSLVARNDVAVITCYFNWCKFLNPTRNFHRFLRDMKKNNIPLYGVELSLTNEFETEGLENWKHLKVNKNNVCFQKEACMNLAEKMVPKEYKKIAWIDCDLIFTSGDWYEQTSKKLEEYKLIQLYTHGCSLNKYGKISREVPSVMYMYDQFFNKKWEKHPGHPGGAWAARREMWEHGGLYPYAIMGGGDSIFIYSLHDKKFDDRINKSLAIYGTNAIKNYKKWRNKISNYIGDSISYIDNKFIHEWHGDSKNRRYKERQDILKEIDFNKNLKFNSDGILEICDVDEEIYEKIHDYFFYRDEDGFMDMYKKIILKNKK